MLHYGRAHENFAERNVDLGTILISFQRMTIWPEGFLKVSTFVHRYHNWRIFLTAALLVFRSIVAIIEIFLLCSTNTALRLFCS